MSKKDSKITKLTALAIAGVTSGAAGQMALCTLVAETIDGITARQAQAGDKISKETAKKMKGTSESPAFVEDHGPSWVDSPKLKNVNKQKQLENQAAGKSNVKNALRLRGIQFGQ